MWAFSPVPSPVTLNPLEHSEVPSKPWKWTSTVTVKVNTTGISAFKGPGNTSSSLEIFFFSQILKAHTSSGFLWRLMEIMCTSSCHIFIFNSMLPVTKTAVTSMSEAHQKHTSSDLYDKYGMTVLQWNRSSCTENSSNTNYNRSPSCRQLLKGLEIINQASQCSNWTVSKPIQLMPRKSITFPFKYSISLK